MADGVYNHQPRLQSSLQNEWVWQIKLKAHNPLGLRSDRTNISDSHCLKSYYLANFLTTSVICNGSLKH